MFVRVYCGRRACLPTDERACSTVCPRLATPSLPTLPPHLPHTRCPRLHHPAAGTVLAAFQPSVPLSALAGWFGFTKKKEAAAFLREKGAVVVDGSLDIKASRAAAAALAAEAAAAAAQEARR